MVALLLPKLEDDQRDNWAHGDRSCRPRVALAAERFVGSLPKMSDNQRIGDVERDEAAAALREHFSAGRLERGELEERLRLCLSAKTVGDLGGVLADLPEVVAQKPQPAAVVQRSTERAVVPRAAKRPMSVERRLIAVAARHKVRSTAVILGGTLLFANIHWAVTQTPIEGGWFYVPLLLNLLVLLMPPYRGRPEEA